MGIPKFFRYISERYPLTSQLIQENSIPEFDNLYLDFNGIIHNCSHPPSSDPNTPSPSLSDPEIFTAIFSYLSLLVSKIKPKQLLFIAVDGVAPRAKMNQQRGRRFRTALEAREVKEKLEREQRERVRLGEKDEPTRGEGDGYGDDGLGAGRVFDSNCITPGTQFMASLHSQLIYFVNKKITQDPLWSTFRVILSGHDVPGEGEHKIMDYIRTNHPHSFDAPSSSNPPATRHCMYGLDADLMMLGLASHERNFALLREEVKFGPARKSSAPSAPNFYLLHLGLLREYINLEFSEVKLKSTVGSSFSYSLERIINDFVLLCIFVGNDFLPHLPDLHINEGGLDLLWSTYKSLFGSGEGQLGGYIVSDGSEPGRSKGTIELSRLELILVNLKSWEMGVWEKEEGVRGWVEEKKLARRGGAHSLPPSSIGGLTQKQKALLEDKLEPFFLKGDKELHLVNNFAAAERTFIMRIAEEMGVSAEWEISSVMLRKPGHAVSTTPKRTGVVVEDNDDEHATSDEDPSENESFGDDSSVDEVAEMESQAAIFRVLKKYSSLPVLDDDEQSIEDRRVKRRDERFAQWRARYYEEKLEVKSTEPKFEPHIESLVYRYVEGLQWVMYYYFQGVQSWGWFFDWLYAPRVCDFQEISDMRFSFELGEPFRPYEQLMGVLPIASSWAIPLAYRDLMTLPPLAPFYPQEFEQDLNGKKQSWEAVVKIPFIPHALLLSTMRTRDHLLTAEENERNARGSELEFSFDVEEKKRLQATGGQGGKTWESSLKGYFPDVRGCLCKMRALTSGSKHSTAAPVTHLPNIPVEGPLAKIRAGFPTLFTLPHTSLLAKIGINVHGAESKNATIVVNLTGGTLGVDEFDLAIADMSLDGTKVLPVQPPSKAPEAIAADLIGKRVFVDWPFAREALVTSVADAEGSFAYLSGIPGSKPKLIRTPHASKTKEIWNFSVARVERNYAKRFGVGLPPTDVLVSVRPLTGLSLNPDTYRFVKSYDSSKEETYASSTVIPFSQMPWAEDERWSIRPEKKAGVVEVFDQGEKVFFLGKHAWGAVGEVVEVSSEIKGKETISVVLAFDPSQQADLNQLREHISALTSSQAVGQPQQWYPSFKLNSILGMSGRLIGKITSSLFIITGKGSGGRDTKKINIGINVKFDSKGLRVPEYARKVSQSQQGNGYSNGHGSYWEFSVKCVELLKSYKATFPELFAALESGHGDAMLRADDLFFGVDPALIETKAKEIRKWLDSRGVGNFEALPMSVDRLSESSCTSTQAFLASAGSSAALKRAMIKSIPPAALLLPSHAQYRLKGQTFELGDRVVCVFDRQGLVGMGGRGFVAGIGLGTAGKPEAEGEGEIEVVWDHAVIGGSRLGGRCPPYRGTTIECSSVLNLSRPQFIVETHPSPQQQQHQHQQQSNGAGRGWAPPRGRGRGIGASLPSSGPPPHAHAANGAQTAQGRGGPPRGGAVPKIMSNPNRGGRGRAGAPSTNSTSHAGTTAGPVEANTTNLVDGNPSSPNVHAPAFVPRGRGGPPPRARGRGRGGFRGRGQ